MSNHQRPSGTPSTRSDSAAAAAVNTTMPSTTNSAPCSASPNPQSTARSQRDSVSSSGNRSRSAGAYGAPVSPAVDWRRVGGTVVSNGTPDALSPASAPASVGAGARSGAAVSEAGAAGA